MVSMGVFLFFKLQFTVNTAVSASWLDNQVLYRAVPGISSTRSLSHMGDNSSLFDSVRARHAHKTFSSFIQFSKPLEQAGTLGIPRAGASGHTEGSSCPGLEGTYIFLAFLGRARSLGSRQDGGKKQGKQKGAVDLGEGFLAAPLSTAGQCDTRLTQWKK